MRLAALLRRADLPLPVDAPADVEIFGIQEDSRLIRTGDLYVARPGTKNDGAKFIQDAKDRGAVAIVTRLKADVDLPQIIVPDAGAAGSKLANAFFDDPSDTLNVIGITGTNGKTTTAYLIRHLLASAGTRCGMIGTVEIDDGNTRREATMTTPGGVEVASLLAAMRENQCRACAIETSSHALDQGRVAGVKFSGAGFTNLTGDHLDYHLTMEHYAASKARLFTLMKNGGVAVVNAGDPAHKEMIKACRGEVRTFGIGDESDADYVALDVGTTAAGTTFRLATPDEEADVATGLLGRHNVENALLAAALTIEVCGLTLDQVVAGLADAAGAPGRLQRVNAGQKFAVLVDYAHTDDALQNVLTALRPLAPGHGKIRVVFGCGGDRDKTKRPRMAATAARLADVIYITSDNPRTENPADILAEIAAGIPVKSRTPWLIEPDRAAAIEQALNEAENADIVLIAGKGHENYQIIGTQKHHFDDVEQATRVLSQLCRQSAVGSQRSNAAASTSPPPTADRRPRTSS